MFSFFNGFFCPIVSNAPEKLSPNLRNSLLRVWNALNLEKLQFSFDSFSISCPNSVSVILFIVAFSNINSFQSKSNMSNRNFLNVSSTSSGNVVTYSLPLVSGCGGS